MTNYDELQEALTDIESDSNKNTNVEEIEDFIKKVGVNNCTEDGYVKNIPYTGKNVYDEGYFFEDSNDLSNVDEEIYTCDVEENHFVEFTFRKELTDEFIKIGERIKELSDKYVVVLSDASVDPLSDKYTLTFNLNERD